MTMPAKNAPSAKDTPNKLGGAVGDADGGRNDAQRKKLARTRARDLPEQPWEEPPADDEHERDKDRDLAERERKRFQQTPSAAPSVRPLALPPSHADSERQQYQDQDHHQIFDDQPADGDAAVDEFENAAVFQRPEEYDRARDGERKAEYDAAAPKLQPQSDVTAIPSTVATAIWTMAPGRAIRRTANRSSREKCKPTPNINSITPISASWRDSSTSATKPGVAGPAICRRPSNRPEPAA